MLFFLWIHCRFPFPLTFATHFIFILTKHSLCWYSRRRPFYAYYLYYTAAAVAKKNEEKEEKKSYINRVLQSLLLVSCRGWVCVCVIMWTSKRNKEKWSFKEEAKKKRVINWPYIISTSIILCVLVLWQQYIESLWADMQNDATNDIPNGIPFIMHCHTGNFFPEDNVVFAAISVEFHFWNYFQHVSKTFNSIKILSHGELVTEWINKIRVHQHKQTERHM